jgi:hypothetical protein
MPDPSLVFVRPDADRLEVVVNFGVFAGREATPAEIDRLGDALLERVRSVEIVCEHRYELDRERRGNVYLLRVEIPSGGAPAAPDELTEAIEAWASDCIAERPLMAP